MNGLHEVDWKELANQLHFSKDINSIEENCAHEAKPATCCRNTLVTKLCQSEVSYNDTYKRLIKALVSEELGNHHLAQRFSILLGIPGEKTIILWLINNHNELIHFAIASKILTFQTLVQISNECLAWSCT